MRCVRSQSKSEDRIAYLRARFDLQHFVEVPVVATLEHPGLHPLGSGIQTYWCTAVIPRVGQICFPYGCDGTPSICVMQQPTSGLYLEEGLLLTKVSWLPTTCNAKTLSSNEYLQFPLYMS